jgi:hypothetical protein
MKVQPDKQTPNVRRGIALGGLAAIASVLVAFNPFRSTEKKPDKKVKLLAQDGSLIEVDESRIGNQGKRVISKEELQEWVKPK